MQAKLTIVHGEAIPRSINLTSEHVVKLGRGGHNHVVLRDQHASRKHAKVYSEDGKWYILDCQTRNGTRLNGKRISSAALLRDGSEIRIGDSRWCFNLLADEEEEAHTPPNPYVVDSHVHDESEEKEDISRFERSELQSLYRFVEGSLETNSPPMLIELALQIIYETINPKAVGFLSLDPENPLPKVVLPDEDRVDIPLSQKLTKQVRSEQRTIWLARSKVSEASESLLNYSDAICMPVTIGEQSFGAIHVYQQMKMFTPPQVHFCKVLAGSLAKSLHIAREHQVLTAEKERLKQQQGSDEEESDALLGDSPAMAQLKKEIDRLANAGRSSILITGETGSGKEVVAVALHNRCESHEGPLVQVNCATMPEALIDRELFGNEKGAYSGADRYMTGFFEQADGGTLVLDEIGELPLALQSKLLRALEKKKFRPLGASQDVTSDVRVMALTNRNLEEECKKGTFRSDLYFRLTLKIHVPPLRDHIEDLPAIVEHHLRILARNHRKDPEKLKLSKAAMNHLMSYHWPGNVRQLLSVLEYAVAMNDGNVIKPNDFGPLSNTTAQWNEDEEEEILNLDQVEKRTIEKALAKHNYHRGKTAAELGICSDTLRNQIKKLGISLPGES